MKIVEIRGKKYELVRNDGNCFDDSVIEKITDYFDPYDYIAGDYAYEKVRFKGFYDSKSKGVNSINNIKNIDNYIKDYCCYGSKIFLLKKIK